MGKIACKNADYVFITTDNPRTEDPAQIIKDITSGVKCYKNYRAIEDRKEAIKSAFKQSKEGDTIMLLGKGCENYIEINGQKIAYSDYDVVNNLLNSNKEMQ